MGWEQKSRTRSKTPGHCLKNALCLRVFIEFLKVLSFSKQIITNPLPELGDPIRMPKLFGRPGCKPRNFFDARREIVPQTFRWKFLMYTFGIFRRKFCNPLSHLASKNFPKFFALIFSKHTGKFVKQFVGHTNKKNPPIRGQILRDRQRADISLRHAATCSISGCTLYVNAYRRAP